MEHCKNTGSCAQSKEICFQTAFNQRGKNSLLNTFSYSILYCTKIILGNWRPPEVHNMLDASKTC